MVDATCQLPVEWVFRFLVAAFFAFAYLFHLFVEFVEIDIGEDGTD